MNKEKLINKIKQTKARSAWARGVKAYALELLEDCEADKIPEDVHDLRALLKGERNNF